MADLPGRPRDNWQRVRITSTLHTVLAVAVAAGDCTMLMLSAGVILFFLPHSVSIVAPHWRDRMLLHMGEGPWKGTHALLIATGLALLVLGFDGASRVPVVLYAAPSWLRYVTLLLMLPVFPLLLATYLPGRLERAVRHPTLTAVTCWAAAHLLADGTLPGVVLFGSFLLWASIDRLSLRQRAPRAIRRAPATRFNDLLAVSLGLALYAAFLCGLHAWLFGVPALDGLAQ